MTPEVALAAKVVELYSRAGFGRVLKSELDLAYFRYFLLKHLKKPFVDGGRIRYYHIDKAEIFRLSVAGGMTESKFKSLLEQEFLVSGDRPDLRGFLVDTVNATRLTRPVLKDGLLRFVVANPLARKALEDRLYGLGTALEYGRNREVVEIALYDFLRLVEATEDAADARLVRENLLAKAGLSEDNPALNAFFAELNAVPLGGRVRAFADLVVQKLTGKAADAVVGALLGLVKL